MSKVDIRTDTVSDVDTIQIADRTGQVNYNLVTHLYKATNSDGSYTLIDAENQSPRFVLRRKVDIENTIKALELAIKLGWYQE